MRNLKSEIQNRRQIQRSKSKLARSVSECLFAMENTVRAGSDSSLLSVVARSSAGRPQPAANRLAPTTVGNGVCALPVSLCLFCFCILTAVFCLWANAQNCSIDWWTVDGGGGTSTGGVYSVSGTIGQPDAGKMSGGQFTLVGGFWSVIAAVQTPGAPYLTVFRTATNTVVVSWPLPAEGWVLQATNALPNVATPWPTIPPPYQTNGPNLQFIELTPVGNKFYRLHKP